MRNALLASVAAALALSATSALADEVVYPDQNVIFATGIDPNPIVTSDVTYPGPHPTVVMNFLPGSDSALLATSQDVIYPTAEPLPVKAPLAPAAQPDSRVVQYDCVPIHG